LVDGAEVISSEVEKRLPLGRFLLLPKNILDHGEREEITILEFFNEADAINKAVIIFRDVPPALPGLGEESFPDIIMNGLF
jgi:hypothetical protein